MLTRGLGVAREILKEQVGLGSGVWGFSMQGVSTFGKKL